MPEIIVGAIVALTSKTLKEISQAAAHKVPCRLDCLYRIVSLGTEWAGLECEKHGAVGAVGYCVVRADRLVNPRELFVLTKKAPGPSGAEDDWLPGRMVLAKNTPFSVKEDSVIRVAAVREAGHPEEFTGTRLVLFRNLMPVFSKTALAFQSLNSVAEITADIAFRNIKLRGKKGRIILQSDDDGDIGLELEEDVRGGSLEGLGKEGHCILVNKNHLRVTSE